MLFEWTKKGIQNNSSFVSPRHFKINLLFYHFEFFKQLHGSGIYL